MPSVQQLFEKLHIAVHSSADDLLPLIRDDLERYPIASNLILHYALMRSSSGSPKQVSEQSLAEHLRGVPAFSGEDETVTFPYDTYRPSDFWITLWSSMSSNDSDPVFKLDFVVSCLGESPLFLFYNGSSKALTTRFLAPRIPILAARLHAIVSPSRIFSCFGPTTFADAFAEEWSKISGHRIHPEPYYHSSNTYCTRDTFVGPPEPLPSGHRVELGNLDHVEQAAVLCRQFAAGSTFFLRNAQQALEEADHYIHRKQLWVYLDETARVTAIVVLSRETRHVVAITKVYTLPEDRRKGYAEALVRRVCEFALRTHTHVVLYVGHDNEAEWLYGDVGFVGVGKRRNYPGEADMVEDWKEVGFEDTHIGYW